MALEINKPSVWIPIVLVVIGMIGGGIVFAFKEFTTIDRHKQDHEAQAEEIAGVSLNQQYVFCVHEIKLIQRDLYDFKKEHGDPPYSNRHTQAQYEELLRRLEDEREFCSDIRKQVKK